MKAGPCNHNLKVLLVSVLLHLLLELFHTAGLDLVDQLAEDDAVLQNLPEVTRRERLSHHLLHPLGEKDEDNDVRYNLSSHLHNLLLLVLIPGWHFLCLRPTCPVIVTGVLLSFIRGGGGDVISSVRYQFL